MTRTRPSSGRSVCLALGSNVGDREQNLRSALARLRQVGALVAVSGLYGTAPAGVTDQPEFRNAACLLITDLPLKQLIIELKQIEWELGRRPGRIWGPRPLDIDIVLAGLETVAEPDLVVPHPRMADRGFVLAPLAEIAAHERHPLLRKDVGGLLASLPRSERDSVVRLSGPEWTRGVG